ncbi:hypothetical protein [Clostridium tertium]|uniref:hypothetical protein n=1 Tax=Clostridium tertium TaxID=1559 RepID=UPI0011595375
MKESIKGKFPQWCKDEETNYELILSNDIDSLMCYVFQKARFNREVFYFFDADTTKYTQKNYKTEGHINKFELLGLDIALESKIKCWDNHVVKVSRADEINTNSANLNIAKDIWQFNYTSKAVVSSFITMLSYYEFDLRKLTKDQLSVICAIDGLYTPFQIEKFIKTGTENLSLLDFEFLKDFIIDNLTYIKNLESKLNLKQGKIRVAEDGHLETNINLAEISNIFGFEISLPDKKFEEIKTFTKNVSDGSKYSPCSLNKTKLGKELEEKGYKLFNFALTFKNSYIYSYY